MFLHAWRAMSTLCVHFLQFFQVMSTYMAIMNLSICVYGGQNQARVIRRPKFSSSGKLLIGQLWIRKFEFNFSEVLRLALSKTHCSRIGTGHGVCELRTNMFLML